MTPKHNVRIGTRRSPLALAQANHVKHLLGSAFPSTLIEIVEIETSGDKDQRSSLQSIGGKGVFIREIEIALLQGSVDIGVHSLKDVTSNTAHGLVLSGFLAPESICDCIVSHRGFDLDTLPKNAVIGTGSMRRRALLSLCRPDISTVEIRGNIDTRLAALDRVDALILSEVSLLRLNRSVPYRVLPSHTFIPAPGQGVICLETRESDPIHIQMTERISDPNQIIISNLQLKFLQTIGFDCQTPLGMTTQDLNGTIVSSLFRSNADFSKTAIETISSPPQLAAKHLIEKAIEWKTTPL